MQTAPNTSPIDAEIARITVEMERLQPILRKGFLDRAAWLAFPRWAQSIRTQALTGTSKLALIRGMP